MSRILIRAGKDPRTPLTPEETLAGRPSAVFNGNVGNVAFANSIIRLLEIPGTEVVPDGYFVEDIVVDGSDKWIARLAAKISDEFDVYVIPLANAFRDYFTSKLFGMAKLIEKMKIPVVIAGVGVECGVNGDYSFSPRLADAVTAFVRAVLDQSPAIGVRGDITASHLTHLGFGSEHVEIIGCPSIYLRGPDYRVERKVETITRDSLVTVSLAATQISFADFIERARQAHPNLIYIPQRRTDLELMLWGLEFVQSRDPRVPVHRRHPLYVEDRMRFFVDARTWLEFNAGRDFTIGSRIHGTIMSLVAGTPAALVVHNGRTRELAEFYEIPWRRISKLRPEDTVESIYAESDWEPFNAALKPRFEILTQYLERSGLVHTAMPGMANPRFDEELAAAKLPEPVRTLNAPDPEFRELIAGRLGWIYRAAKTRSADIRKRMSPFHPPSDPNREGFKGIVHALRRAWKPRR